MVQHLVVGLIVFAAALYSLWMLMPATVRRTVAARLAWLARRCGLGEQDSQRLQARLATGGSCSACDSCKGCPRPVAGPTPVAMPRPADPRGSRQARSD
jgi:hypothetical protein